MYVKELHWKDGNIIKDLEVWPGTEIEGFLWIKEKGKQSYLANGDIVEMWIVDVEKEKARPLPKPVLPVEKGGLNIKPTVIKIKNAIKKAFTR